MQVSWPQGMAAELTLPLADSHIEWLRQSHAGELAPVVQIRESQGALLSHHQAQIQDFELAHPKIYIHL